MKSKINKQSNNFGYLITQSWQVKAIRKTLKKADAEKAKFFDHDKVTEWLNSWIGDNKKSKLPL